MLNKKINESLFTQAFFTTILIIGVILITIASISFSERNPTHKLTPEQVVSIRMQLGKSGFEVMKRYRCDGIAAEYLVTGKWTDTWCYNKYRRLRFN